jgi:hypothetical protein
MAAYYYVRSEIKCILQVERRSAELTVGTGGRIYSASQRSATRFEAVRRVHRLTNDENSPCQSPKLCLFIGHTNCTRELGTFLYIFLFLSITARLSSSSHQERSLKTGMHISTSKDVSFLSGSRRPNACALVSQSVPLQHRLLELQPAPSAQYTALFEAVHRICLAKPSRLLPCCADC